MKLDDLKNMESIYWRVGRKDENPIETCSVEIATGLGFDSVEDLLEVVGYASVEDCEENLDDVMFWDDDGHLGAGIYYNGVCCSSSLAELAKYFRNTADGLSESIIFVFEGEWIGSCNDGDVVIPTKVLATFDTSILEKA